MGSASADKARESPKDSLANPNATNGTAVPTPPITLSDLSELDSAGKVDSLSTGFFTQNSPDTFSSTRQSVVCDNSSPNTINQQHLLHHECGSNQSGSDSGLGGCTNSLSSENSLIVSGTGGDHADSIISGRLDNVVSVDEDVEHGKSRVAAGVRLASDVASNSIIDDALNDLSNNRISYGRKQEPPRTHVLLSPATIDKSDSGREKQAKVSPAGDARDKLDSSAPILGLITKSGGSKARHQDAGQSSSSGSTESGPSVSGSTNRQTMSAHVESDKIDCSHHDGPTHQSQFNPIDVPLLRSALKKPVISSAAAPIKSRRNVSFNQTVIVFCEEIETTSPNEYDPPVDYRDTPDCITDGYGPGELCDENFLQSTLGPDSKQCELDILSRIVGKDASKLTDDQLFGLLENGSLLGEADAHTGDQLAGQRLRLNQGYLCHDALSDTDSESSLMIDDSITAHNGSEANKKTVKPAANTTLEPQCRTPDTGPATVGSRNICIQHSQSSRCARDKSIADEPISEQHSRSTIVGLQKSTPARMKVSTVENQPKRGQRTALIVNQQSESQKLIDSAAQDQPRAIHSSSQQEETGKTLSLVKVRQGNIKSVSYSKPQSLRSNLLNSTRQSDHAQNIGVDDESRSAEVHSVPPVDQYKNRQANDDCCPRKPTEPQAHQHPKPTLNSNLLNGPSEQKARSNVACHICHTLETNQQPTNISVATHCGTKQISDAPSANHAEADSQQIRSNLGTIQRQPQSVEQASNSQSCISCREIMLRSQLQQAGQRPSLQADLRPSITNIGSQQSRSIPCQVVYVLDQNGNRIRALQVIGPPQASGPIASGKPIRQILLAPSGNRLLNPTSTAGQQLVRIPSYGNQVNPSSHGHSGATITSAQQVIPTNAHTIGEQSFQAARDINVATNSIHSGSIQKTPPMSQSASRNHTIYYVKQPLNVQNNRDSHELCNMSSVRTFPDAHEIRRLDGIRAPAAAVSLVPGVNDAYQSSSNNQNDRLLASRMDDPDDPSFGFSKRPAVKVVSTGIVQNQGDRSGCLANGQMSAGYHTLDRRYLNRTSKQSQQSLSNTSSMTNISRTLNSLRENSIAQDQSAQAKSKGDQRQIVGARPLNATEKENSHAPERRNPLRPEVAYVMNI